MEESLIFNSQTFDFDSLKEDPEAFKLLREIFLNISTNLVSGVHNIFNCLVRNHITNYSGGLGNQIVVSSSWNLLTKSFTESLVCEERTFIFTENRPDNNSFDVDFLHLFGNNI